MKTAVINPSSCDGSPFCPAKRSCPAGAIVPAETGLYEVIESECTGCGACVPRCPHKAIRMK